MVGRPLDLTNCQPQLRPPSPASENHPVHIHYTDSAEQEWEQLQSSSNPMANFLLKFIIIGESGTGKSCLLHHFLRSQPRQPSPHTIGVEFSSTIISLPSSSSLGSSFCRMKLQIWDTAGQERFRSVTRNYYRGAAGAILVYDITDRASFTSLSSWLADARSLASPDLIVILVGNKVDLEEDLRQVDELEASDWAKQHDCLFLETSSWTGESVSTPFLLLTRSILLSIESGRIDPDRKGSGISYGERALKRVTSWGGGSENGFEIGGKNDPQKLTPLRAHYLKRELVTLQFAAELERLSTPHVLSLLGPPFLPSHLFKDGTPIIPEQPSPPLSHHHNSDLPFLRFFFHRFVLSFPFLENVPSTFFSHKLQPFVYSFFSRNITRTDDREEETKRQKIAGKVEKHLALIMAAAIKLADNRGQEQVVRVHPNIDPTPNDDDAFVSTPIINPPDQVRLKSRMRSKIHEEFVIRTRSQATGEVYVSRRYRDFFKLAESLRAEFPDIDIRSPPPKDRSAIHTDDLPSSHHSSPTLAGEDTHHPTKIHFIREHNRLTLRAYLHRLLTRPEICNSDELYRFLTDQPIELSPEERHDAENREAIDRARENEKSRFRLEVEGRVKELDDYLRGFREELVKSDGLSRVFATIREIDSIDKLPIEYRKVIEWSRISLASTIYQVFLGSDNSSASFAQLKRMHALLPYWAMRGVLKISNPVAMIRGVLDLFLARPFGATSLVQRMFSSGLYEEIREFKEDAEKVAVKIADDRLCERIKTFVEAPREIQELFEEDARSENVDLMAVILRSPEGPKLDKAAYQRIQRASQAYERYKTYRDGLDDPALDEDIVTIFYAPLMQVYKAANISDSLVDLQKFIDDLIRTVERADEVAVRDAQKIVQTFVDLVARHEGAFYNFVHQVHSKGAGLFDGLMHWIELLVNFVRQGLTNTISLEALLPHPDTPERLALMNEIDEIIEYHRRLKIAHHERMLRRLARDGPEERASRAPDDHSSSPHRKPSAHRRNGSPAHNKAHKNKEIEPPNLLIVPTLTPLFTELVKNLLH
ncbi:hypothetical protein PtA15_10A736 [Puccinia triticina]|uniref:PX domain-containing protein n=1 Tax=Puccinia triticina TaxID=208348 RepID=A0ABY7CZ79_9BASI|nr:uncharacterized protein PtA15_10A736 [Puccinia triticina]WAQ89312.1 hypothetical protein PtA15_10A736 [Puccinia triticina]